LIIVLFHDNDRIKEEGLTFFLVVIHDSIGSGRRRTNTMGPNLPPSGTFAASNELFTISEERSPDGTGKEKPLSSLEP
jgi:hypothetical protein